MGMKYADELESVHRKLCKFVFWIPRTAANIACYGELGQTPLLIKRKVSLVKYWFRVVSNCNVPDLVKYVYNLSKSEELHWARFVKDTLNNASFPEVSTLPLMVDQREFLAELEPRPTEQYIQSWLGILRDTSRKLRTYKLIKQGFKREPYLSLPPYLRVPITRLRTSSHSLRIETGRYNLPFTLPPNQRVCWFCMGDSANEIEDELHFLFNCRLYA